MSTICRCLALLLLTLTTPALAELTVFRCTPTDGPVRFQQQPCAANEAARQIALAPQPPRPAFIPETRVKSEQKQRKPRQQRQRASRSQASRRESKPAPCPPTRENPGSLGTRSVRTAWLRYIDLPSKTYLKNAGRWPRHCD